MSRNARGNVGRGQGGQCTCCQGRDIRSPRPEELRVRSTLSATHPAAAGHLRHQTTIKHISAAPLRQRFVRSQAALSACSLRRRAPICNHLLPPGRSMLEYDRLQRIRAKTASRLLYKVCLDAMVAVLQYHIYRASSAQWATLQSASDGRARSRSCPCGASEAARWIPGHP